MRALGVVLLAVLAAAGCAHRHAPAPEAAPRAATFLMFEDRRAEPAMQFYTSLFPESSIDSIERYGPTGPGPEGTIKSAAFTFAGQQFMASDTFVKHAFTFTPSMSIYIACDSEAELDALAAKLSEGGSFMMPPGNYGFSRKFAWVSDRFGVSWQLNLP